ncbi:hypothetical protein LZ575_08450 [Antarcticibacterium sp. 1MA-6-2]|uniref:hypothetical protein n=1 Tax=Antarcticibacterium sp. 1MA-6-2 TaxID=2908210 RepID=UPI001F28FFE1|nr:hypothetical protein [Antarcticibacterium sp. 1MA-6-2]UJH92502.1 hypothetical protein LZ575_08450 [Antarcticibacterium sp. 1MA-6-2]
MKYLVTNKSYLTAPLSWPIVLQVQKFAGMQVLLEKAGEPDITENNLLIADGYLRDLKKEVKDIEGQKKSVVESLQKEWPLISNITSFFFSHSYKFCKPGDHPVHRPGGVVSSLLFKKRGEFLYLEQHYINGCRHGL